MRIKVLMLIAAVIIAVYSCNNDEKLDTTDTSASEVVLKSATIASSDVVIESVLTEADYEAGFFAESEELLRKLVHSRHSTHDLLKGTHCGYYADGDYPVVSVDTAETGYPIVITVDYGDSTVVHHGTVVSGIVTIELSAARDTDGATTTITYQGCKIDSVGIDGTSVEVFNGDSVSKVISSTLDVKFVLADSTELQLTGSHVREWLSGVDTPLVYSDDSIQTTGSYTIVSSTGDSWTKQITEPLIKSGACKYIVQGIIEYTVNGEIAATLDYGDGTCDNVAVLTVDGEDIEIELRGSKAHADVEGRHHHTDGGH